MKNKKIFSSCIIIGLLLISIFVLYSYIKVSLSVGITSDNAISVVEGYDMSHGNILLHNWSVASDNFLTSDIPIYAIFTLILNISPYIVGLVTATIYFILFILSCTLIYISTKNNKERIIAFFIILLTLGTQHIVMLSPAHLGTIIYTLIIYILYYKFLKNNNKIFIPIILLLSILALYGDPQSLTIFIAPIIISFIISLIRNKNTKSDGILNLGLILAIPIATKLRNMTPAVFGGARFSNIDFSFITPDSIYVHITDFTNNFLNFYNANFFGKVALSKDIIPIYINLIGVGLVILSLGIFYKKFKNNTTDRIEDLLFFSVLINLLTTLLFQNSLLAIRFLFPFYFFSALLAAKILPKYINLRKIFFYTFLILSIIYILNYSLFIKNLNFYDFKNSPEKELVGFLEKNNLTYGYGDYWNASILNVQSYGKLSISGITVSTNNTIESYYYANGNMSFYSIKNPPIKFIVFPNYLKDKYITAAENSFGKEKNIYSVGNSTVMTWDKNLTPYFTNIDVNNIK